MGYARREKGPHIRPLKRRSQAACGANLTASKATRGLFVRCLCARKRVVACADTFSHNGVSLRKLPGAKCQLSPPKCAVANVSDLPCNFRREGGFSLVIGGSPLVVMLAGKACNPL